MRKVPLDLREQVEGVFHRESLGTRDFATAQRGRNLIARADDELWAELRIGDVSLDSFAHYEKVIARAKSMQLQYLTADKIADQMSVSKLLDRIGLLETAIAAKTPLAAAAVIGSFGMPSHKVSEILKVYSEKIMTHELSKKNDAQKHRWKTSHERYLRNFMSVCGDVAFDEISRADGLAYKDYFEQRILDTDLDLRITPGAANREIGTMAVMYKRYFKHYGQDAPGRPFDDLKFKEGRSKPRDYFEIEWLKNLLMKPELLAGLNLDARVILLCMVETGMRPIEICNIDFMNVNYDKPPPHVIIEPRDGYELKTESSRRVMPLVGVSFFAFVRLSDGYNRYMSKPNNFSGAVNKYFRENGLFEREGQTIYSMRHTFKNRMIEAGIDEEMRDMLMGHASSRPEYGDGGGIVHKSKLLTAMQLPHDPKLFDGD